jgi:aspartyl aminopeptidase
MASSAAPPAAATGLVSFLNSSVTAYHAVDTLEQQLDSAGFQKLSERVAWDVKPGGAYYCTRNKSAILAFAVGGSYVPGNGFTMTGAHTDSPCLRLKPISSLTKAGGVLSVGVETYGGGLWYSWLDRDLSVAGRVIVEAAPGRFESRLIRVARPILRIPSLAIHLNREVSTEVRAQLEGRRVRAQALQCSAPCCCGATPSHPPPSSRPLLLAQGLKLNAESHLPPLLCTAVKAKLAEEAAGSPAAAASPAAGGGSAAVTPGAALAEPGSDHNVPGGSPPLTPAAGTGAALTRHHAPLVRLLASELGVAPEAVCDFDLCLYDTQVCKCGGG